MTVDALALPSLERRCAPRFRFPVLMPATLGRGDAVILDISADGARVIHFSGLARESRVRLVFAFAERRFAAKARVLASRVSGLGNGPGGATSFETRLQFVDISIESIETLDQIVQSIELDRIHTDSAQYFMRCRLVDQRWTKCWTREAAQPHDGFTVPAKLSAGEVDILCEAYERMDEDNRQLIRATAAIAA